jgi:hypothetical protein
MRVTISIDGILSNLDGLSASTSKSMSFEIPPALSGDQILKMKRDSQILVEKLDKYPRELDEILGCICGSDSVKAAKIAQSIGFEEEAFSKDGGGLLLQVAIVIAIVLIARQAH